MENTVNTPPNPACITCGWATAAAWLAVNKPINREIPKMPETAKRENRKRTQAHLGPRYNAY